MLSSLTLGKMSNLHYLIYHRHYKKEFDKILAEIFKSRMQKEVKIFEDYFYDES